MSLPTADKRGFGSLLFLSWFLIILQIVTVRIGQMSEETRMLKQIEVIQSQERELIPLIRWIRFQQNQRIRCEGYRPEIDRQVQWKDREVHLGTSYDNWIFRWDEISKNVTDYEYQRR